MENVLHFELGTKYPYSVGASQSGQVPIPIPAQVSVPKELSVSQLFCNPWG